MYKNHFNRWLSQSPDGYLHDNPERFVLQSSKLNSNVNPALLTPAASLANVLTYAITKSTGTNAMTGFGVPSGFRGIVILLPSDAANGTTGGTYASDGVTDSVPFKKAWTAIAGSAVIFVCDGAFLWPADKVS